MNTENNDFKRFTTPTIQTIEVAVDSLLANQRVEINSTRFDVINVPVGARIRINSTKHDDAPLETGSWIVCDGGMIGAIYITTSEVAPGETIDLQVFHGGLIFDPAGTAPKTLAGIYEAVPTSVVDGATKTLLIDQYGRMRVRLDDVLLASEDSIATEYDEEGTAYVAPDVRNPINEVLKNSATEAASHVAYTARDNLHCNGLLLTLEITNRTVGATPNLGLTLRGADASLAVNAWFARLEFDPTVSNHTILIAPHIPTSGAGGGWTPFTASVDYMGYIAVPLPRDFDIYFNYIADITNLTYSLDGQWLRL